MDLFLLKLTPNNIYSYWHAEGKSKHRITQKSYWHAHESLPQ